MAEEGDTLAGTLCYEKNIKSDRPTMHDSEPSAENESTLSYVIHKYSSYSTNYYPCNIYKDDPSDQASRWSSDSSEFPQFLILKLRKPSIVKTITFGKYEKAHVCNIKKFCIYGGLTDDNMILLLESGLKNNATQETFSVRHTVRNNKFPVRYIKIMPLQTWGSTFNYSIWHVALRGCGDWKIIQKCINAYSMYREKEAIRLCLKHLREHNYTEAFESLLHHSSVNLEDPFLTEFYDRLVKRGDYDTCETLIHKAHEAGYFQQYITQLEYKPKWTPITAVGGSPFKETPGMRGGHQMCIDVSNQIIFLFGGWDGKEDLSDLWSFNIVAQEWTCISRDTQQEGGPCGRSCHKMCLDSKRRQIFTLGRFVDPTMRTEKNLKSDFYLYDIDHNKWTLISEDTATVGGPSIVFDHQIAMDVDNRIIYVFGGRVVTVSEDFCSSSGGREHKYSGLYSYHVATSTWTRLREDGPYTACSKIKARIGHSMLFHGGTRQLFVLGGQRDKEFLTDFFTYNIDSDTITFMSYGTKKEPGSMPSPGFTQKGTIDVHLNEIHILAGLSKEKNRKVENVRNSFWIYNIPHNKWSCVYHNELSGEENENKKGLPLEPCPRYAYQLVYDDVKKVHYLFGGNPGIPSEPHLRLDDFWSFYLSRPTADQLLRNSLFLIRRTKYRELAFTDPVHALSFLQTSLHDTIDHHNASQVKEFQGLASTLFQRPSTPSSPFGSESPPCGGEGEDEEWGEWKSKGGNGEDEEEGMEQKEDDDVASLMHRERLKIFQQISLYLPEDMTQPRANLVDFIPY